MTFVMIDEVNPQPVEWLVPGRLARGHLHLLDGDPGLGKSLVLLDLARESRCAIQMLRHLNKQEGGRALYRGLASIAFTAACRIAWLIGPDPKVPRQYVLTQAKNNLESPPSSLAYRITGESNAAATIEWLGPSIWSGSDLLRADPAHLQARLRARLFVEAYLKGGPQPAASVLAAARDQGLSKRTTQRAAKDAKVRRHRVIAPNQVQTTYWLLPGQELPAHLLSPALAALEPYFRRLEEDFPPRPGGLRD